MWDTAIKCTLSEWVRFFILYFVIHRKNRQVALHSIWIYQLCRPSKTLEIALQRSISVCRRLYADSESLPCWATHRLIKHVKSSIALVQEVHYTFSFMKAGLLLMLLKLINVDDFCNIVMQTIIWKEFDISLC